MELLLGPSLEPVRVSIGPVYVSRGENALYSKPNGETAGPISPFWTSK